MTDVLVVADRRGIAEVVFAMMTPAGWARQDPRYRAVFTEMYVEHWSAVRDHINLLFDDEEAEEIASEVFQVAWDKLREPVPWGRVWLLRTADNKIQNHLRRSASRSRAFAALEHQAVIARQPLGAPDLLALRQGLEALPPRQRRVIHLHYWDEMSAGEVGVVLGISEVAVWTELSRGRARLRALLDEEDRDGT